MREMIHVDEALSMTSPMSAYMRYSMEVFIAATCTSILNSVLHEFLLLATIHATYFDDERYRRCT